MYPGSIPIFILAETAVVWMITTSWSPLAGLLSIQLRLAAYTFLRWIPGHHGPQMVPLLFALWCLSWVKSRRHLNDYLIGKPTSIVVPDQDDEDDDPPTDGNRYLSQTITSHNHQRQSSTSNQKNKNKNHKDSSNSDLGLHKSSTEITPLLSKPVKQPTLSGSSRLMRTLIGLPTDSRTFNLLTLLVNLVITIFCLDLSFRTLVLNGEEQLSYTRIGAVGESWAKIHVRIPPAEHQPGGETGANVIYRPMEIIGEWSQGPTLITQNETDWTAVGKLADLWPGTTYEYRLTGLSSWSEHHELFPAVGHFKTAPDSSLLSVYKGDGGSFTFAYTSCIKPGFPYNPLRHPLHNDGAEELAELARDRSLDFVIFLGDFIYADTPFYPGNALKHYWRKYRQSFATEGWSKLIRATRTIHIYDDHEIYNDWAGQDNDTDETFQAANQAYQHYLGKSNYDGPGLGENYYWFRYGDAAFFVWDCRRYRSPNGAIDDESKTMLGAKQKEVNSTVTFKFVVSSTPFMTLWLGPDGGFDTWAGFTTERTELMDVMEYVPNLIVLSGDRHEFAAASIRESVIEFSTSPLNQFWLPIKTLSEDNGLGRTGEDKLIKYIPEGNRKFSTLKVDCHNPLKPLVKFDLYVDGVPKWNLTYIGKPVREEPKQIGEVLLSWNQLLKILKPTIKWFSS